jgi:integrase
MMRSSRAPRPPTGFGRSSGCARLVADVLGHANVSTTLSIYAHTTASQHEQAAAILGEAL